MEAFLHKRAGFSSRRRKRGALVRRTLQQLACVTTECSYNGQVKRDFRWNERKRRSNLSKHGLDFADCAEVFAGPIVTVVDDRYHYGEIRYITRGLLKGLVVIVAHTDEDDGVVRVISLRKADKDEQTNYFETLQN